MIVNIPFLGRLNKDDKILPPGDYEDAKNIVIDQASTTGSDGGEIKKLESFTKEFGTELGTALTDPSIIAQAIDPDGNIYVLSADTTNAVIEKITQDETVSSVLQYNHNSVSITEPDMHIVDGVIIWNYYGDGTPLSWNTARANAIVTDFKDISFIKAPPVYPPQVTEVNSVNSYSSIAKKQFQFACRYIWDTGDVSVLSPITKIYGGRDNISSFIVNLNSSEPSLNYVSKVEYLVREGNGGNWERFLVSDYGDSETNDGYFYTSKNDEESDFTKTGTDVLSVYNGAESNIGLFNSSAPTVTMSARRDLTGLAAGLYQLSASSRSFNINTGAGVTVTISLKDDATDTTRASISFDETEPWTYKSATYQIPSTADYYILIEYADTTSGYNFLRFSPVELLQDPVEKKGFYGQSLGTIPSNEGSSLFDFVPLKSESIAVQDNRVFFGNNTEIYEGNEGTVSLSVSNGTNAYPTGGISRIYITDDTTRTANRSEPALKGYASNSRYGFGLIYLDEFLRTRGIEAEKGWTSPKFGSSVASVTITRNAAPPSWAKYYRIVRTKSLDKDFTYEGVPSGFYFLVEQASVESQSPQSFVERSFRGGTRDLTGGEAKTTSLSDALQTSASILSGIFTGSWIPFFGRNKVSRQAQIEAEQIISSIFDSEVTTAVPPERNPPQVSITSTPGKLVPFLPYLSGSITGSTNDLYGEVKYFVIDINAMFQAERPYNFQPGDIVSGHFESSTSGTPRIIEMEVVSQEGNLIYCDPTPILKVCDNEAYGFRTILGLDQLTFSNIEIYSPSKNPSIRYYAVGDVYPISDLTGISDGGTVSKTIEGDLYWTTVSLSKAQTSDTVGAYDKAFAYASASSDVTVTIGNGGSEPYPKGRFNINTVTSNYLNNNDFSIEDGIIRVKRGGAYRIKYIVEFNTGIAGTALDAGIAYASFDLTRESDNKIVASSVFTYASGPSQVVTNLSSFEAAPGDSFYLAINGRQYADGSGTTKDVDFTLSSLWIGHSDYLVGDFTFGLIKKPLTRDSSVSVVFKSVSPSAEINSWNSDIGRPYAKLSEFTNTGLDRRVRFGGKKLATSSYSRMHSFDFVDYRDLGSESGSITALQSTTENNNEGGVVLAICKNTTHSIYVGARMVQSMDGSTQIAQSDDVIGAIRELIGGFGTSHKKSVATHNGVVFWWDERKKSVIRYTREGLFPVSNYKMRSFFNSKSAANGVIGFIDPFYQYYHICLGSDTYSTAFNMDDKWVAHYDIKPDCRGVVFNNYCYLSKSNFIYKSHTSQDGQYAYSTFFKVEGSDPYIKTSIVFPVPVELTGLIISSNTYKDLSNAPSFVKADTLTVRVENTDGQYTEMDESYFTYEDGNIYSHIMRDMSNSGNKYNGVPLIGSNNRVKLTLENRNLQHNIRQLALNYEKSFGHVV